MDEIVLNASQTTKSYYLSIVQTFLALLWVQNFDQIIPYPYLGFHNSRKTGLFLSTRNKGTNTQEKGKYC